MRILQHQIQKQSVIHDFKENIKILISYAYVHSGIQGYTIESSKSVGSYLYCFYHEFENIPLLNAKPISLMNHEQLFKIVYIAFLSLFLSTALQMRTKMINSIQHFCTLHSVKHSPFQPHVAWRHHRPIPFVRGGARSWQIIDSDALHCFASQNSRSYCFLSYIQN